MLYEHFLRVHATLDTDDVVTHSLGISWRGSGFESYLEQLIHLHIRVIYEYAELGIYPSRSSYHVSSV